jgi:hypothetical protein
MNFFKTEKKASNELRVLIREDAHEINQLRVKITDNLDKLNFINSYKVFKTQDELAVIVRDRVSILFDLFINRHPEVGALKKLISSITPEFDEDLLKLDAVISSVGKPFFSKFDKGLQAWLMDNEAFEKYILENGLQVYAHTPEHLKRLKIAEDYAQFVSSLEATAQEAFANPMIVRTGNESVSSDSNYSTSWIPNWNFIVADLTTRGICDAGVTFDRGISDQERKNIAYHKLAESRTPVDTRPTIKIKNLN